MIIDFITILCVMDLLGCHGASEGTSLGTKGTWPTAKISKRMILGFSGNSGAMASVAAPDVLRGSHACLVTSAWSFPGTSMSATTSASYRTNCHRIRPRVVFVTHSRVEASVDGGSGLVASGDLGSRRLTLGFSRRSNWNSNFSEPVVWSSLSRARYSPSFVAHAKKVAELEVKVEDSDGAPVGEEEEVGISWIQEKAEDLVVATGQAIDRVPGPRVGGSRLPWLVAVPVGYIGFSFVLAVVKTYRKYTSPKGQRKRQVGKNAYLCEALGEYFPSKRDQLDSSKLQKLANKCNFSMIEVVRKYVRYTLNERPFTPETVADLLHLRKISGLTEPEVAEVLNDVAKRIVKAKGPVVMNTEGFTEKGIKRKAAVQALFSKLLYLSELEEFVASDNRSALTIKTTFGVTDDDANQIRIDTLSEQTDVESLERMVGSAGVESDDEEAISPVKDSNETN